MMLQMNPMKWFLVQRSRWLRLAEGAFFVTCAHVLEKFQEIQADHPNAQLVAYTTIPKFTELFGFHLIDAESRILDVAIFCGASG